MFTTPRAISMVIGTQGKTNKDALKAVAELPLSLPTGSKYEYTNTDYSLLAILVQTDQHHRTGQRRGAKRRRHGRQSRRHPLPSRVTHG